jgi:DNA-binding SARP family transcriptional activator
LLVKHIQTLGGMAVFDDGRPLGGNAKQPRRLAVLAVLARAGERGVNRDRLAALLWGEQEEERGRRSLNQALYALRQELGSEEAILGTRDLRLNPELIEVDLAAFEIARASGAFEEAARLYAAGRRRRGKGSRPTTARCSRRPQLRPPGARTGVARSSGGAGWRRSTRPMPVPRRD